MDPRAAILTAIGRVCTDDSTRDVALFTDGSFGLPTSLRNDVVLVEALRRPYAALTIEAPLPSLP